MSAGNPSNVEKTFIREAQLTLAVVVICTSAGLSQPNSPTGEELTGSEFQSAIA
jgi:hypothetical protein